MFSEIVSASQKLRDIRKETLAHPKSWTLHLKKNRWYNFTAYAQGTVFAM